MSSTFASHAARLAGEVCRTLAWRPDDFWSATPAEIAAIFAPAPGMPGDSLSRSELQHLLERDAHE